MEPAQRRERAVELGQRITLGREQLQSLRNNVDELLEKQRRITNEVANLELELECLLEPAGRVSWTQRIIDYLAKDPCNPHDADEITAAIGSKNPKSIKTLLWRLERSGRIERDGAGLYWSVLGRRGGELSPT